MDNYVGFRRQIMIISSTPQTIVIALTNVVGVKI
jgi:hypothetical protein